jgi:hypothetical protein
MRVKWEFFKRGTFKVGSVTAVCFWEDTWLGDSPLSLQYTLFYNIVQWQNVLVSTVLTQRPLNIGFKRKFKDYKYNLWLHLCQ